MEFVNDIEVDDFVRLVDGEFTVYETPMFEPVGSDEQGQLDQKKKIMCPECGHEF